MSVYRPNDTIRKSFTTHALDGSNVDADSTPTGILRRNGTDTAESVTVSSATGTGNYEATVLIPIGWSVSDIVELMISATVLGVQLNR